MNALTNAPSSATDRIRRQLERVTHLRTQAQQDGLSTAVHQVKQLQARRFRATYADFLAEPRHAATRSSPASPAPLNACFPRPWPTWRWTWPRPTR
jgi:hypothetical protein